jgi:subtilisin-like proprotein convertase family protein
MKIFKNSLVRIVFGACILTLFVFTSQRALLQSNKFDEVSDKNTPAQSESFGDEANIPLLQRTKRGNSNPKIASVDNRAFVGTDIGTEREPNNTVATANALGTTEGKIRANAWSETAATTGTDTDYFSFTTTVANSKIYAATKTSFSASGSDSTLDVIAGDGTTVLETDLNDGSFSATSSSISGTVLPTPGTYYLRVTNVSATSPISPYDLYFAIKSATPTVETEPNNNGQTPNPVSASGLMSGVINPAADSDTYSIAANAGDTIYLSLDTDPERDNVQWNGRLGLGLFGTPTNYLVVNDASVGSVANPLSEAFFMTVRTTGTYVIYIDEPAGSGAATDTYTLNATVVPATTLSCTTYTNATSTPIADAALTSSTITVPGSPIIKRLRLYTDITHTLTADLDVHLVSPAGNDNGVFTDITTAAAQTAPSQFNVGLDDFAGIPIGSFTINSGMIYQPELAYRLDWFTGENAGGDWRLDIRDDLATNTGTLNSWSLEVCTDPAPVGNLIYNQNFEANNGGYTHTGTLDEWAYGTPATPATTTTNPVAAFNGCASGTNCWKTDLTGTYELSSSQDLTSPNLNLTNYPGTIKLYWQQKYQMESVAFDRIWVRVSEVGNPANNRIVWHNENATMADAVGTPVVNIGESAGWGRYNADISDFAGKNIQVQFHLDSDTSVNYGGYAIDDVQLYHVGVVAANANIGGRILNPSGNSVSNARVTLVNTSTGNTLTTNTNSFGYYRFENLPVGQNYTLEVSSKRYQYSPQVIFLTEDMENLNFTADQ